MTKNLKLKQPTFNWHLELSSKCSLKCPRCPRTEKMGMYKITEMDLDFVKSFLTTDILSSTSRVLLCGGQGDPVYCKDILKIIKYIKESNNKISIRIVTNGSYKTTEWWQELSDLLNEYDIVIFSIDGWDNDSNNIYRVNSDFDSIINGIKTVSKNEKITVIWSTILFSFNEEHIEEIKKIAKDAGANKFQLVKSSLFGSKFSSYIDSELGYDPLEPTKISDYYHSDRSNIYTLKENKRSKKELENFSNLLDKKLEHIKDYFNDSDILPSCLINERGLYVDAEGILYPCSWVSHPFNVKSDSRKTIKWEESLFVKHKKHFSLKENSLYDILNSHYWNKITNSFFDNDKKFIECLEKCTKNASMARIKYHLKNRGT